ncbi:MAG TPA: chromosome partition protein MukB, partial [Polyangiaceae bacterium]
MTRARASALVLVNWKGVFYERYLLDRNVTSLEGANGAGKTTVMIAAYVVLLPDMSRLRFTNLGETAGTAGDRGIWGRLGEPGRPSYAAMELTLPGDERLVIGVHLERKTEPSLEPRAFFVSGLRAGTPLSDLFLIKHQDEDAIPELKELSENASRLGAQMEIFRSTKEYFSELFERGIFALRLANEDDRSKFNEMLRTSMTGGISRALTSELRGFLLREETGLSDALSRMRANLDTCRRTRAEVVEAQKLEGEISGVHRAAQAMLRAAFSAARAELAELAELAGNRESERDRARDEVDRLAAEREETTEKQRRAAENAGRTRELAARVRAALERAGRAREVSARVAALREEKVSLDARTAAAAQAREGSGAAREAARARRAWAQEALARAAAGLA